MRQVVGAVLVMVAAMFSLCAAEVPSTGKIVDTDIQMIEREVVSLAEAMSADKYEFVPTSGEFKGARTFAQQMKHIAALNYMVASASLGEANPIEVGKDENGPVSIKGKDAVLKFLKDSYVYAHKAALNVTDENAKDMMKSPFGEGSAPRMWIINVVVWHSFDHYGQAVVYSRMNGIIPPATQAQ